MLTSRNNPNNLRIIKTARDEESINIAARNGLFPLIRRIVKSPAIRSKFAVLQNPHTGEIKVIGDYRSIINDKSDYKIAIDFAFYYPYDFPSPFAAYLIPSDIKVGERVYIEDLIEDHIGATWNQGDTYRLSACEAIWNGNDFDMQDIASQNSCFVG